ncbi:MAG: extracellular solute-binding protein, partial [Hyphomicrobiales bacterium]|nr:extracellular solute-binding protein [Hyphomicrobiales bacterium]
MTFRPTRRILVSTALATVMAAAVPFQATAEGTLRMLTWEGYAEDDWVKEFEEATGATVNISYAGSVDEMFAKMASSNGADFDLVAVDTSSIPRYIDAGLIAPVDLSRLKNFENLMPEFQSVEELQHEGDNYGVPFAWGSIGLIYDTEFFGDNPPDSWATLWNEELAGRLIALDDANNNVVTAALYLGFEDPYNLTDEQFEQVKEALIETKGLLATYYSGFDEGVEIWKQNAIVANLAMGEFQAQKMLDQNMPVKYIIPKEGAIGWLDCLLLSAGAENPDLVYAWVDHVLQKKIGQELTDKNAYGNTTNPTVGMEYADRLSWLQPPEDFNKRI